MLSPSERSTAIDIAVKWSLLNDLDGYAQVYSSTSVKNMLLYGHRGFASYSDMELMRYLQAMSITNNDSQARNFIANIAAAKFILE
jgi:hypothetical protein